MNTKEKEKEDQFSLDQISRILYSKINWFITIEERKTKDWREYEDMVISTNATVKEREKKERLVLIVSLAFTEHFDLDSP